MPNYIKNKLFISGENSQEVKNQIKAEERIIDFNKIIKMPDDLYIEIHSGIETTVKKLLNFPLNKVPIIAALEKMNRKEAKDLQNLSEEEQKLAIKAIENYRKYGHIYWYDWAIDRWGTKWNAFETKDESDFISFETAWSTPFKVIIALSLKYPKNDFKIEYADEDIGSNCGSYSLRNGQIVTEYKPEGKEASDFALQIWGYNSEEYYANLDSDTVSIDEE